MDVTAEKPLGDGPDGTRGKQPLVILTGPTAVGKTELSIELAKRINGEIISADSMQVYIGMDIGSAKVTRPQMQGVPHHLIDELEPDEPFHVVKFQELAKRYIAEIYSRGKIPVLAGGTGFYIQAVLYDIDFTENEGDSSYRQELERQVLEKGADYLHQQLVAVDQKAAQEIHANNVKRVIRALEFFHETGTPISRHNETERQKKSPYQFAYFVLNDVRQQVYARIDKRVDLMMEAGLLEEVKKLKAKGYTRDMVSMQGLGYKEILDYLEGNISLEEAVYIIKRDTRHFAKRQLTWFKREPEVTWVSKDAFGYDRERILDFMLDVMKQRGIAE
ncbi:MAG: tRNA (adenosine(37)-N6)-dimethylallyltransferase MiaA [Lachnospiraceae bacterium]|nr:tRNA (adenosine(37)-N6)-dimethylallyltransferase MiaA [Lachnospiraceae bacterium]